MTSLRAQLTTFSQTVGKDVVEQVETISTTANAASLIS
jgi:hypothetical protein